MPEETPESSGATAPQKSAGRTAAIATNVTILLISLLVSLFIAEAGYRLANGISLLDQSNWRERGVRVKRIGDRALYDLKLGWALKPGYRSDRFNTIAFGIRRNFAEAEVRTGSILAAGDSFTEGFDVVKDDGTWPAHLEKILGQPVVNGGVAGYATDQIILRAEQLLPIIQPKTLVVGFTNVDFSRAAMSEAGAPKPYFTVENDQLVYHAPAPLDPKSNETVIGTALRSALSYSALSNRLLSRLTPRFWYPREAAVYTEVPNDPFRITCLLLQRLKRETDASQVKLLLFLQYDGELVLEEPDRTWDMQTITQCAQAAGIQVADQFASLKALTHGNPDLVDQYYSDDGDAYGHMTSKGNEQAATVLAEALKSPPVAGPVDAAADRKEPLPN